jgi:hypothetical protein
MGVHRFIWRDRSHLRAASPAVRQQSRADAQRGRVQERFSAAPDSGFRPATRDFLARIHTRKMAPSGEIVGPPRPALAGIHCSYWKWTSLRGKSRVSRAARGPVGVTPTGSSLEARGHVLPGCGPVTRRNAWPWTDAALTVERAARAHEGSPEHRLDPARSHLASELEEDYQMAGKALRSLSLTKEFGFDAAYGGSHDVSGRLSSGESLGRTNVGHDDRSRLKQVNAPTADRRVEQ